MTLLYKIANTVTICHSIFHINCFSEIFTRLHTSFTFIMASNRYCVDIARLGTASCKNCTKKIDKGLLRIGKIIPNPFNEGAGDMKHWFHARCAFEKLSRARATTKKIESSDDLEGWSNISEEHQEEILKYISEFSFSSAKKTPKKQSKSKVETAEGSPSSSSKEPSRDDMFREFRKLCCKVSEEPKYLQKTAIMKKFFTKGTDGDGFKGDLYLWVKLLLPNVEKRIYNLQSKQLVKLFSEIFEEDHEEMLEDLDQGDVAATISKFFQSSTAFPPANKSTLTLQQVDEYLDELSQVSKELEQSHILKKVAKKCTANDLQIFIRFIKHDLRMNAGPKPVLDAIHSSAYEAFQASRNLKEIVSNVLKDKGGGKNQLSVQSSLMTPVIPMLAQACNSVEKAFAKCPNGFYVEIKYDGERVQVHKKGHEFSYFSRSLKPVMPHKVMHFKEYIQKAFPHGNNLMLDSEILLVSKEGLPLPFGTLGAHRKNEFKDATVCLFVFDCLQFNDQNLMKKPLCERREVLHKNMTEIKNHIMFSEMKEIKDKKELRSIINSVIKQGLEGLVIKDKMGIYEPGKRHWLKVKKDYLEEEDLKDGVMADSADLVVLGAYYGTGKFGGIKNTFLMGCYDENSGKWRTVTKVTGFSQDVLDDLQDDIEMTEINKDQSKVPQWLKIKKSLVPDFIVKNPEESPVWEIVGAEFSKSEAHTANGISIRFPRVKCFRDKTWQQSTTLSQLQNLYDLSKQTSSVIGLKVAESSSDEDPSREGANDSDENDSPDEMDTSEPVKPKSELKRSKGNDSPSKKKKTESPKSESTKNTDVKLSNKRKTESPKSESTKNTDGKLSNKVLPDIFTGVKLYIPSSVDDAEVLCRYFVSYNGTLLRDHEKDQANVVLHDKECKDFPEDAEVVSVEWLWACIKLQKRMPVSMYKPDTKME